MRLTLVAGAAGVLMLALAPPAAAADLEPVPVPASYGGFATGRVGGQPARKPAKEPEYKSTKPLHFTIELGSGEERFIVGVLDESKGTGTKYDNWYPAIEIGPNGALYNGAYGGIVSMRDMR